MRGGRHRYPAARRFPLHRKLSPIRWLMVMQVVGRGKNTVPARELCRQRGVFDPTAGLMNE